MASHASSKYPSTRKQVVQNLVSSRNMSIVYQVATRASCTKWRLMLGVTKLPPHAGQLDTELFCCSVDIESEQPATGTKS